MPKELPIPPAAGGDSRAIELVRVWAAHGNQHISLATSAWDDPAAWGIMLVDLAKHIAAAYEQTTGMAYTEALGRVREGFEAEWEAGTDEASGGLL
jgi:hypothetical protein